MKHETMADYANSLDNTQLLVGCMGSAMFLQIAVARLGFKEVANDVGRLTRKLEARCSKPAARKAQSFMT